MFYYNEFSNSITNQIYPLKYFFSDKKKHFHRLTSFDDSQSVLKGSWGQQDGRKTENAHKLELKNQEAKGKQSPSHEIFVNKLQEEFSIKYVMATLIHQLINVRCFCLI